MNIQDCTVTEQEKTCPKCGKYFSNGLEAGTTCGQCAYLTDLDALANPETAWELLKKKDEKIRDLKQENQILQEALEHLRNRLLAGWQDDFTDLV